MLSWRTAISDLLVDRRFRLARLWSNDVLRRIGPLAAGEIVNVSAWEDADKEGERYRDYFPNASHYFTTNYGGFRGGGIDDTFLLDLEAPLPDELKGRFDVVFNHTTLEHIFDVFRAVENLCSMTRDAVIIVVPAVQQEHWSESFSDYWRFTTRGLKALLQRNGLEVMLLVSSPYRNAAIYHLILASRQPERWRDHLPALPYSANEGRDLVSDAWYIRLLRRIAGKRLH